MADSQCVVAEKFVAAPSLIAPENYPQLLDIQSTLGQKSERTFLLERD